MAALLAGFPVSVAGLTFNRLCSSGLAATNAAARAIKSGEGEVFVAGGGHPLGCRRARIMCTLVHEIPRRSAKEKRPYYDLATLCVGVGQGETTVVGTGG